jgi:hypothetical protein
MEICHHKFFPGNCHSFAGGYPLESARLLSCGLARKTCHGGADLLTMFVFDRNFINMSVVKSKLSDRLRFIDYGLRLDQNWGMFAPGVFKDDRWCVQEGVTENMSELTKPDYQYSTPEKIIFVAMWLLAVA